MSAGKLIIQETEGGLHINGITDYEAGLGVLVGTAACEQPIELAMAKVAEQLPAAIRRAVSGGKQVMEGLIAFSKPIFIKGAALDPAKTTAAAPAAVETVKTAAYVLDDTGYRALLHILDDLGAGEEHIKQATHPFHTHLTDAIEAAKVDGRTIGFNVPVKVAFRDEATRDLFMNWFGDVQKKRSTIDLDDLVKGASASTVSVEAMADMLVAAGAVRGHLSKLAG